MRSAKLCNSSPETGSITHSPSCASAMSFSRIEFGITLLARRCDHDRRCVVVRRLVIGDENLATRLGKPYQEYIKTVPRGI
jgi:protein-S-isoprenylcysteine O-methyltransferase Ste14